MTEEVEWKEYNIHGDELNSNGGKEDKDFVFHLFDDPEDDPYETKEYVFSKLPDNCPNKTILLRGHSEIQVSTGLALWLGSEVMCQHLINHPGMVRGKNILELGSGMGLCGIVCHYLGASKVLMTDGDKDVLENLRHNVSLNLGGEDEEQKCKQDRIEGEIKYERISSSTVSCPQLIWGKGKNTDDFQKLHGLADVVIATDCVYTPQSLEPMWQTIHHLLKPDGIFTYVNRCLDDIDIDLVKATASRYSFGWEGPTDEGVYTFRRCGRKSIMSKEN